MRKIFEILFIIALVAMTGSRLGTESVSETGQAKYDKKMVRFEIEPNDGCPICSHTSKGSC